MNYITVMRRNWRKTVLGMALSSYGIYYGHQSYQISNLLKSYSKEAAFYGEQCHKYPKRIMVILNPAANKKKSEKMFQQYCEPLLHLSGFMVEIVKTESEGYAKAYLEQMKNLPDAIVIAGGDGTVSEVLTGMLRRNLDRCPIAILPLGKTNTVVKKQFQLQFSSKVKEVEALNYASITIARGLIVEKGVIKIEQIMNETDKLSEIKPVFSMGNFEWGILRDIISLEEKYWYLGGAKTLFTVLLNAFNNDLSWKCKANICYTLPCAGCTNCIQTPMPSKFKKTWWKNLFIGSGFSNAKRAASFNKHCSEEFNDQIESSNVRIHINDTPIISKLVIEKEGIVNPGFMFVYNYLIEPKMHDQHKQGEFTECRTMNMAPDDNCKGPSKFYSIDNELYDVRPIRLTALPKAIQLYMPNL